MNVSSVDLVPLIPIGVISLGALLLMIYEVSSPKDGDRTYTAHLSIFTLVVAAAFCAASIGETGRQIFVGVRYASLYSDDFGRISSLLVMMGAAVTVLLSPTYAKHARMDSGEYYALILISVVGMQLMVMAGDLITFFLGLETMSIAVYPLAGMRANDSRASEAALKYFLTGAFATGFLLFGITLVYGATGGVDLAGLAARLQTGEVPQLGLLSMGLTLIVVGFGFKVAAVPFHMWAPDVYEGAATPVTGFMAVAVKSAAFLGFVRLVAVALAPAQVSDPVWIPLLSGLAIVTVVVGNVVAVVQTNVKRMLAYSSISHAGYILIGVVAAARGESTAVQAVLFYLTAYTFTTLGAFGVLTFLEREDGGIESERFGAFAGVGWRHPMLGLAMVIFMIALAGMPPTAGFFGKLYVFSSAIRVGDVHLALVGVGGSIVSVYYYLRVLVSFYMREHPEPGPGLGAHPSPQLGFGVFSAAVLSLVLGLMPSYWLSLTDSAGRSLQEYVVGVPDSRGLPNPVGPDMPASPESMPRHEADGIRD